MNGDMRVVLVVAGRVAFRGRGDKVAADEG